MSVTLRNVAVIVANQRSYVIIIIVRKEGGTWERTPQAIDRSEGQGMAEMDGAWMGVQPWWWRRTL